MIKSDQINLNDISNKKLIYAITNGIIHQIRKWKYSADIIVYVDGPEYWIELVMTENGKYNIENYQRIR